MYVNIYRFPTGDKAKSTIDVEEVKNGLNKSSTETKLDKYFDEVKPTAVNRRKFSEISNAMNKGSMSNDVSSNSINKAIDLNQALTSNASVRRRKGSTISNLSNLDFHGSCLQIHAVS